MGCGEGLRPGVAPGVCLEGWGGHGHVGPVWTWRRGWGLDTWAGPEHVGLDPEPWVPPGHVGQSWTWGSHLALDPRDLRGRGHLVPPGRVSPAGHVAPLVTCSLRGHQNPWAAPSHPGHLRPPGSGHVGHTCPPGPICPHVPAVPQIPGVPSNPTCPQIPPGFVPGASRGVSPKPPQVPCGEWGQVWGHVGTFSSLPPRGRGPPGLSQCHQCHQCHLLPEGR